MDRKKPEDASNNTSTKKRNSVPPVNAHAIHQYHGAINFDIMRTARRASDWVGSRGCVRLQEADARALFYWAPDGTRVIVE
ncbi:L,D-transpeptidase [Phaeovibrio sulfidiphilus]|uniref:L,D-transpeptidase n=1 Tax=Phaeovibrio sulfidiphilus TaxID=1220600 RepID=A0A8J6YQ91_9PROT|nr:L,D-transpeptidase [Phaeovibrio sulfidiphilus]